MAAFVYKVFTLAIRTASKPLASRFQAYVLDHPTFRPQVLKFGQSIHAIDFAMTRFAEGKSLSGANKFLAALDDERALELAGKFVSEGFVLAVGVGVIYWDYKRGNEKDQQKALKDQAYKKAIDERFLSTEGLVKEQRDSAARQEKIMKAIHARQDQLETLMHNVSEQLKSQPQSGWRIF